LERRAGHRLRGLDAGTAGSGARSRLRSAPVAISVFDADPDARAKVVGVKIAARTAPVLPQAPAGSPFPAVSFEGLTATGYVIRQEADHAWPGRSAQRRSGQRRPRRRLRAPRPRSTASSRAGRSRSVVPPASQSLSSRPLALLSRRYGARAPAVVELIRRTGGCTSPIRSKVSRSPFRQAQEQSWLGARRECRLRAFVLVACGNRRESRCPPCSERYRRDAYFLVAPGCPGAKTKGSRLTLLRTRSCSRRSRRRRSERSIVVWSMPVVCVAAGHAALPRHANTAYR